MFKCSFYPNFNQPASVTNLATPLPIDHPLCRPEICSWFQLSYLGDRLDYFSHSIEKTGNSELACMKVTWHLYESHVTLVRKSRDSDFLYFVCAIYFIFFSTFPKTNYAISEAWLYINSLKIFYFTVLIFEFFWYSIVEYFWGRGRFILYCLTWLNTPHPSLFTVILTMFFPSLLYWIFSWFFKYKIIFLLTYLKKYHLDRFYICTLSDGD